MALDLEAIHTAVADQIRNNVAREINVFPLRPENPPFPYLAVVPGDPYVSYHETFASSTVGALCDVQLELLIVQNARSIDAQMFILELLSAGTGENSSVVDAIETDRTLGGVVETCLALRANQFEFNDDGTVSVSLPLQIVQRRT
jgi:hypothetical protein